MTRPIITASEALELLPVSRRTFYRLVETGVITRLVLRGMKYGRYKRSQIEEIADTLKQPATTP